MTTLQELDEVLAKVVDNQFDNILDASRVGVDCAIFLKDHAPEIRAALELQAKLEQGFVLVPRELLSEVEDQLVDLFNEKSSRGVMYREREKLFDADILQRVRLLTHSAPPAQGEQDDAR